MPEDKNKDTPRNRLAVISTEISFTIHSIIILFILKQIPIILDCKNEIYLLYSEIYPWLITVLPVLCGVYIIVDLLHPFVRVRRKIDAIFRKRRILCIVLNTVVGTLAGLLLVNTIATLIVSSPQNNKPSKITILYDTGSMNRFAVRELATPLILEAGIKKSDFSVLPLSANSLVESVRQATYLIVLSHGDDGKAYSTHPLKSYEYSLFERIKKENLRLAYFSACYLGVKGYREKWRQAMKPAKIILYDRESAMLEHGIWLVFKAKGEMERVWKNQ